MKDSNYSQPGTDLKNDPLPPDQAIDIGSQADVDEIMKKYDRESNTRPWTGKPPVWRRGAHRRSRTGRGQAP